MCIWSDSPRHILLDEEAITEKSTPHGKAHKDTKTLFYSNKPHIRTGVLGIQADAVLIYRVITAKLA